MKKSIRLHPDDNVAVAVVALQTGEVVQVDGRPLPVISDIAAGHKVALCPIPEGSKVRRNAVDIGSAISPVIKICANPATYRRMQGDMDINAGRVLEDEVSLDQVGEEICARIVDVASGEATCSEALGHQEFTLTYKTFEPSGPACYPRPAAV